MATVQGTANDDRINSRGGNDLVNGLAGEDVLIGANGHDTLNGGGEGDMLYGVNGRDQINGGNGFDSLYGGRGDDTLDGGNGGDLLNGELGSNTLYDGNGDDTFVFDALYGGTGVDTVKDFDVDRELRNMTFDDSIELLNVGGLEVKFVQVGDDVDLYFDDVLIAHFEGSEGAIDADDLAAATTFTGTPPADIVVDDMVI